MEWGQLRGCGRQRLKIRETSEGIAGVYACAAGKFSEESGVKNYGGLRDLGAFDMGGHGLEGGKESVTETEMFDGSQESQVWKEGRGGVPGWGGLTKSTERAKMMKVQQEDCPSREVSGKQLRWMLNEACL